MPQGRPAGVRRVQQAVLRGAGPPARTRARVPEVDHSTLLQDHEGGSPGVQGRYLVLS